MPPWDQPTWRDGAIAWIQQQLSAYGAHPSGEIETIHERAWSTVLRVPTDQGPFFFKAGGPTQLFEPALLRLLSEKRTGDVLPLIASDAERGWSLLPDGGQTLRQATEGKFDPEAWQRILPAYAALQMASAGWQGELLAAGVPDLNSRLLTNLYTEILTDSELILIGDGEDALTAEEYERLWRLAPTVADMFAELESVGIPAALEHGDLHDANVFVQGSGYCIFDWGDAALTHPFFTLLIPLRHAASKLAISEYDEHPQLLALRDAYLKPWIEFASHDRVQVAWRLAWHLAKFARTINWYRLVKTYQPETPAQFHDSVSGWFKEFLIHPTDRFSL